MIDKYILDEDEQSKRTRAERRRNDYLKAKKFKDYMLDIGWKECEDIPLGRFTKNTSFNETPGYGGYHKTKNKGSNHDGTYAPTHNYKHSDKIRITQMEEDLAEYLEESA